MSQYHSHSDSESNLEFDSIVPDVILVRSLKTKKHSEASKELKRLEKRRQTRLVKLNDTSNALLAQSADTEQQQQQRFIVKSDEDMVLEARLRQEKILDRQAAKKVIQRQRKLKSKNSTQKIRRDILKKKDAHLNNSSDKISKNE